MEWRANGKHIAIGHLLYFVLQREKIKWKEERMEKKLQRNNTRDSGIGALWKVVSCRSPRPRNGSTVEVYVWGTIAKEWEHYWRRYCVEHQDKRSAAPQKVLFRAPRNGSMEVEEWKQQGQGIGGAGPKPWSIKVKKYEYWGWDQGIGAESGANNNQQWRMIGMHGQKRWRSLGELKKMLPIANKQKHLRTSELPQSANHNQQYDLLTSWREVFAERGSQPYKSTIDTIFQSCKSWWNAEVKFVESFHSLIMKSFSM
jgi:hypothetical protein